MTRRVSVIAFVFWCVFFSASALSAPDPTRDGRHHSRHSRGVVLFGGFGDKVLGDTWVWNGENWEQKCPKTSPPARYVSAMAYDEPRNEVVLFAGGDTNGNVLSDTWVWNGETWKQKFPAHHPSSRYNHGMAYDASRREVVLVGGFGPAITDPQNTDTWVWNGQDWKQRFPAANPGAREVPANLAYDEVTKRIVLFGGAIPLSHFAASDTWEWDGHNWQDKTSGATESGPNGMYGNISLAYDAVNRKVVFLGLNVLNSDVFLATWLWNGSTWQQVFPQHSPPARGQMAADIVHRKVVLFDGDNTSTWNGHDWTLRGPSSSPPFRSQFAISSNPAPCRDRHDNGAAFDAEPVEDQ